MVLSLGPNLKLKGSTYVEINFLLTQSPNPTKLTGIIMVKSEKKQHTMFTILALLSMLLRKEDRFLDFYETISRLVLLGRMVTFTFTSNCDSKTYVKLL